MNRYPIFSKLVLTTGALLLAQSAHAATLMGYLDTDLRIPDISRSSDSSFEVSTLSLLFSHEVDLYRFFAEFEAAPSGADTTTPSLERAWIEAGFHPLATMKFGKEVSPTLWQLNHYPHIIVPFTRPLMVRNIFKEYSSGLQLRGKHSTGLKYYAWASNNDGVVTPNPTGATLANPGKPSLGAKLGWEGKLGSANIDVSGLTAHYNDYAANYTAWGAEANISLAGAKLWSEWAVGKYDSAATGLYSSAVRRGLYAVLSYAFTFGNSEFSPFAMYDTLTDPTGTVQNQFSIGSGATDTQNRYAFGLNYKPEPNVVLKAEFLKTAAVGTVGNPGYAQDSSQVVFQAVYFIF